MSSLALFRQAESFPNRARFELRPDDFRLGSAVCCEDEVCSYGTYSSILSCDMLIWYNSSNVEFSAPLGWN